MRVDISAHVKLRNRLSTIRMFIRIAVVEALKSCVDETVDEVEGAFVRDWATN
jgi:hypothetical protein